MNKLVQKLILEYFDSYNSELNDLLKKCDKEQRKYDKDATKRAEFIISILGKNTYRKYSTGEFAPVPLSAMRLTYVDFTRFSKDTGDLDDPRLSKFLGFIKSAYSTYDFNFIPNGVELTLQTNIVFRKLDEVIDFFMILFKAYKKAYKSEDIRWNFLVKKFRNYLQ